MGFLEKEILTVFKGNVKVLGVQASSSIMLYNVLEWMSHGFLIKGYLELKISDQLVNLTNRRQTQSTLEKDESILFTAL